MSIVGAPRTLRFQLIGIVILTVALVLTLSQWVNTRLSERVLEQDMRERALLVLRTVDSLWGKTDPVRLRAQLTAITQGDREIVGISIYRLRDGQPEVDLRVSERDDPESTALDPPDVAMLAAKGVVTQTVAGAGGSDWLRISVPIRHGDAVIGAAQVDLVAAEVSGLKRRLRAIYGLVFLISVVIISLSLSLFLERRVARPLTALVNGMRRAERGELGIRVKPLTEGEFGFLIHSFNRMLSRIDDLTAGLEERVRAATQNLADKNRELHAANERLWQAQLDIGRGERLAALGQMAGTLAHELGTPLNSVLGYVQLLQREQPSPERAEKLAIIESQVQRMIDTIRSVLDRTRDVPIHRDPVAIEPLVSETLSLVSAQLFAHGLAPEVNLAPGLPPVPGDAVALRQVMLNLLTNAIDASNGDGGIAIGAATVPADDEHGAGLEITVRDGGHGMSPDEIRRAFEPFYTTKAPGRGTGLGLVIVDHIVRAHGGHLSVDSAPGQGTTMRVRLPLEA